ncbi:MAG: response regulator [Gemmatimonadetes bacterium]|nr:response regulator [Gemmatimonadota bacterium]
MTRSQPQVALVVDDDARSRELLQQLLMLDGYEVRAVGGGHAALALLADEVPDVAVIDLRMPGMDGVQLCRKIRGLARPGRDLPVVVLTGMDDDASRQAAVDAGADDVLVKPVIRAELRDRLIRVRAAATAAGRGSRP